MRAREGASSDWRERRRMLAFLLRRHGWYQRDIAEALTVSEVSVSHWLTPARFGGIEALRAQTSPGHPSALSAEELAMIPEFLWHGPEAYGFNGQVWTCGRIARVIQMELGVAYDKGHVSRLLRQLRWTPQMPIQRAIQRDEEAIERWRKEVWPRLLKESKIERRTLVFVDEAGFYLLPSVVRTYAPVAQTPVLHPKLSRDHLSVMGGLTPAGKIYTLVRQESLCGLHSIEFLMHLLRVASQRLLVIWDGSPIHRREMVQRFIRDLGNKVRVEQLPAYAPDLNPWDEGGWNHLKNVEMRNLPCRDAEELHEELHLAIARLRQKPRLIRSFYVQAGLGL